MLIQLEIDLRDRPPAELAAAADQVGHYLAEMTGRGHTGSIRMIDLSVGADEPDTDETNFAAWYGRGFLAGYENGLRLGRELPTFTPRLETVDAEHPDTSTDIPAHATAQNPPPRVLPPIAAWVDPEQTGIITAVPAATPSTFFVDSVAHMAAQQREQGQPAVVGPQTMDEFLAAQKRIREQQADIIIGTQDDEPDGERPPMGDGAPVSAYDEMGLKFAHETYGFPEYPDDGRVWIDNEGASWAYNSAIREWDRKNYPTRWATPAPAADPGLLTHPDGGRPTP